MTSEDKILKKKLQLIAATIFVSLSLTGCGEDPQLTQFRDEIETFCTNISNLDTSINSIDASLDTASEELLGYLDELDVEFQKLAAIDFPEEFDYLENLSDEASEYMTEAVSNYHTVYSSAVFDETTAAYAHENYSRAYKRVQVIITFLHGETPEDADLTIEYGD